MKKLALAWYTFLFFPLIILIHRMISGSAADWKVFFMSAVFSLLFSFLGYAVRVIMYQFEGKKRTTGIIEAVPGIMLFVLMTVIHPDIRVLLYIYMFAVYYIGVRIYDKELQELVSTAYLIASSGFYLLSSISLSLSGKESFYTLLIPYAVTIVLWLYLSNSKNISAVMSARNYDERYLPSMIRPYNFKITSVIGVIAAVFLLFYKIMSKGVAGVIYVIGKIIIMLTNHLEFEEDLEEWAEEEILDDWNGEVTGPSLINQIFQILCIVVFFSLGVWLLILAYRNGILGKLFRSFADKIKRFFKREDNEEEEYQGYTDVFEDISGEEDSEGFSPRKKYHNWNEQYNKYLSMQNGKEKFRFGYYLVSKWIRITDPSAALSETPYELAERINKDSVNKFTEEYYPLRYGSEEYSADNIKSADVALQELKKNIRKKSKK